MKLHVSSHICATFFFFTDTAPPAIYTLSLHDALPISPGAGHVDTAAGDDWRPGEVAVSRVRRGEAPRRTRSEEHTSELQSRLHLVCRLLLEKKKKKTRELKSSKNLKKKISNPLILFIT